MIIAIFIIKKIATDLSKQQALDVDPKAIQQINFTANLNQPQNTMFFIIEEAKQTILDFQKLSNSQLNLE